MGNDLAPNCPGPTEPDQIVAGAGRGVPPNSHIGGRQVALPGNAGAVKRRNYLTNGCKANRIHAGQRSAFAAVSTENGAVVVHVLQDSSGVWLQNEYGYFETWTQAQASPACSIKRMAVDQS